MITLIVGNLGSGKTLLLSAIGIAELEAGKKVYATYHVTYETKDKRKVLFVDVGDLLGWFQEQETQFLPHSGVILFDEGYAAMDSRTSMSVANRLLGDFVLQSRKLGLDLNVSCQLASTIDLRIRRLVDCVILAEAYPAVTQDDKIEDASGNYYSGSLGLKSEKAKRPGDWQREDFHYTVATTTGFDDFWLEADQAKEIFRHYSTQEVVLPPMITMDRKAAQAAKKIKNQIGIERREKRQSEIKPVVVLKKRQKQR